MSINPNQSRRRATLISLILVCLMLLLGVTVFGTLRGLNFVAYWLACMALTLTTVWLAIREMRHILHQNREEKIGLMEKAFDDVTAEVKEARDKQRANRRT